MHALVGNGPCNGDGFSRQGGGAGVAGRGAGLQGLVRCSLGSACYGHRARRVCIHAPTPNLHPTIRSRCVSGWRVLCVLQIATWLVKARAQDVMLVRLPLGGQQQQQSMHPQHQQQHAGGRGGREESVILATAVSQRHGYACAEAVRYQVGARQEAFQAMVCQMRLRVVCCQPRDSLGMAAPVPPTPHGSCHPMHDTTHPYKIGRSGIPVPYTACYVTS